MNRNHSFRTAGLMLLVGACLSVSFESRHWSSPVKGTVTPPEGALRAWVISKTDTANAPVLQGNFIITDVKPGNYTLMVEAKPPYRDSFKQDVVVIDGQPTDVGTIQMNQ